MTAASSGGGAGGGGAVSGGATSPSAPRAMKRELAFALQSLSEITASPGRTRSGRSISSPVPPSSPAPAPAAKRRKTRSDPQGKGDEAPPSDLVSPTTPPLDAEAPKPTAQGLPLDALVPTEVAGQDAALVLTEVAGQDSALARPEVANHGASEAPPLDAEVLPEVSHDTTVAPPLDAGVLPEVSHNTTVAPPLDVEVLPEVSHLDAEAPPLDAEVPNLAAEVPPVASHEAVEGSPKASQDAAEVSRKASHGDVVVMMDAEAQPNAQGDADLMGPCVFPLPTEKEEEEGVGSKGEEADFVSEPPEYDDDPAKQDAGVEPSAASSHAMPDTEEGAGMELDAPPALLESTPVTGEDRSDNKLMDACHGSNGPNVLDNVLSDPPASAEDATTPASTAMAPEDSATPASTVMAAEDATTAASTAMAPKDSATPASTAMAVEEAATPASTAMAPEDSATPASSAMAAEDSATPASSAMAAEDAATPTSTAMAPEDSATPASTAMAAEDAVTPASTAMALEDSATPASTAMAPEDSTTSASTSKLKPKRRFKRSLLGLDRETAASEIIGDASVDLSATPGRRFTRSLFKPKVEACPTSSLVVVSEEPVDSTPETPPSVTKMEMKMSKKVACLSKHPGNIKDLLSTGLLEGMPVMYINPNSKKPVLKGVITGCNIRCYCVKCDGSKAVTTYLFEQHAGSSKKHPAEFIYLANGNSLRKVLHACQTSPLESLDKTIQSCIDPMLIKSRTNCVNCNGQLPSSQAEQFLCHHCCPDSKQPQGPTSPYACSKSNSSLTPSSKESLLNRMSASKGGSTGKVTTKDTGLHKLVFKVLLDGTELSYYVDGQKKVDGYVKDQRIYCNHCNTVVSPSAFEAHAGEGSRRKPYDNIFTSNGVSLHELSMKISREMALSERETDDLCRECGLGGDIFPCKMCPRSFHPACVGLSGVPSEWFCDNCTILVQKEKALAANKNAKAAGRQAGVDSIEQIMKRAIRIVPICDDLGGCALCKKKDFNNAVFDERTVILCDQCEKEYHVGCLRSEWQVDLKELPEGEWFCCDSCSEIRSSLGKMISEGAQPLLESDIDIIKKKHESKGLIMDTNTDIRWQLLAGRSPTEDGNLLLSSAVPIIHQSFDPIIEAHTGRDLIPEMVHGRRPKEGMPGQDYSGMYCAVLTVGSNVVSAALLRVMGGEVAELPLVATSMDLQGLGYFQVLFSCVERLLISLKVKHFMLPAAHEAEAIWMKKFGFSKVPQEQLEAYLNGAHLTVFHGTLNLYKAVSLP